MDSMRRLVCTGLCVAASSLIVSTTASGAEQTQQGAYWDIAVRLQTPKKDSPRSREGGLEHAPFRLWLPPHRSSIRGLVMNPFYTRAVTQEHWQAACRLWDFGILATNFFGVKKTEFPRLIDAALKEFARRTGHAELAQARLCLVGMSAGAGMSVTIAEALPDRVIAVGPVCLEVGPRTAESRQIPILTVFGEKDGRQYEKLMARLTEARAAHARFAIAVQWGRRHEFGRANNLLFPHFHAAIQRRLKGPTEPLEPFPEVEGWLGDVSDWRERIATIAPFSEYPNAPERAAWLPDATTAHAWQAFVTFSPQLVLSAPPGLGDGQPFVLHRAGEPIDVQVRRRKTGRPAAPSVAEVPIEIFAGAKRIAHCDREGRARIRFETPGIYPLYARQAVATGVQLSRPNTIVVLGPDD